MNNEFRIIIGEQTPKAESVEFPLKDKQLYLDFLTYTKSLKNAIGLAANQVEYSQAGNTPQRFNKAVFAHMHPTTRKWGLVFNPVINSAFGDNATMKEGCLTWPGKVVTAKRREEINVSYQDIDGIVREETLRDFQAQIWQHEYNHIMGIPEEVSDYNPVTPVNVEAKVNRNEPCPCGSGKKFKKCCG